MTAAGPVSRSAARSSAARPEILVVSGLFPPFIGGSGALLYETYRRIQGRSVAVLTDNLAGSGAQPEADSDLRVVRAPITTSQWGLASLSGTLHHLRVGSRIRSLASRRRTIAHCGRALPEGVAAWLSYRLGGPRYICWSHGEDVSVGLTSRELAWVMTRVYRSASAVFANSRNTRSSLLELGLRDDRVHVVYPGVDPGRFHPGVDGRALRGQLLQGGGDVLLLSVGRLQRRKGHDLVLAALAALKDTMPGLRYVVAGDGEERARLESLVTEHGLQGRVIFAGAVPESRLPEYFAASDVFLMPNRRDGADIEGFGIVYLEAAASGKPSIGGRNGGVPEAVDDGKTGLLVSGIDAAELARAIRRLATDADERRWLGRAGRARVLQHFTWDQAAARVRAVHDAIVGGGGTR